MHRKKAHESSFFRTTFHSVFCLFQSLSLPHLTHSSESLRMIIKIEKQDVDIKTRKKLFERPWQASKKFRIYRQKNIGVLSLRVF